MWRGDQAQRIADLNEPEEPLRSNDGPGVGCAPARRPAAPETT